MVRFIKFNNIVLRINSIESISKAKTKKENGSSTRGAVITMINGVKYYSRDSTMLGLYRLVKQPSKFSVLGSGNLALLRDEEDITEDVSEREALVVRDLTQPKNTSYSNE